MFIRILISLIFCLFASHAYASDSIYSLPASDMSLMWALPFAGILLSLALLPVLSSKLWHHHNGKISVFWSLTVIIPMSFYYGYEIALYEVLHTYLLEFIPFILVAMTLFTLAGGIKLRLACCGTPGENAIFMLIATFTASWIGTTGAAMLFIRPFIVINTWRRYKTHTILFFILLVCNLGGSLTALGDPPLFLGFLKGVPFFWPFTHMMIPLLLVAGPTLMLYYFIDHYYYHREDRSSEPTREQLTYKVRGKINFLLLSLVMATVIISAHWKPGISFEIFHVRVELQNLLRDIIFICLTVASMVFTAKKVREYNQFTWDPIKEVVKLFACIFITAMPVIAILGAGDEGALAPLVHLVNRNGQPVNDMYFWLTGGLSAFLDNAPTYLVFFHLAGGDADLLSNSLSPTLTAISAGAVFMGALTYIGNAPNFLVKSIAEINNISMPSFFGYMMRACAILLPLFVLLAYISF